MEEENKKHLTESEQKMTKLFESVFFSTNNSDSDLPFHGTKDPDDKSDIEEFVNSLSL